MRRYSEGILDLRFTIYESVPRSFVPEGQIENSPAFQRRDKSRLAHESRRDGWNTSSGLGSRPSLRDCRSIGVQPRVERLGCCRVSLRDSMARAGVRVARLCQPGYRLAA